MSCCVDGFTVCPVCFYFCTAAFNIVAVSLEHPSHVTSFHLFGAVQLYSFYDTTSHTWQIAPLATKKVFLNLNSLQNEIHSLPAVCKIIFNLHEKEKKIHLPCVLMGWVKGANAMDHNQPVRCIFRCICVQLMCNTAGKHFLRCLFPSEPRDQSDPSDSPSKKVTPDESTSLILTHTHSCDSESGTSLLRLHLCVSHRTADSFLSFSQAQLIRDPTKQGHQNAYKHLR